MKITKVLKLGKRLVISLDSSLPDDFRNHSDVSVDGVVFSDALVTMPSGKNLRQDLSVQYKNFPDIVGKELVLL
ncbi:hypothetical protein GGG87_03610 [Streptococcus sp. zg-86]|uniref:Uncharacterized protein n=1 Tax=Streptococcus zhangguiae TaxID=2664091 RepID=A0A6I4RGV8_9STRE|nr:MULTISPECIES: hypothetical protein [unclassified Streptococcus]MTB64089.1 hypothetical protein [Streptococcus sp. zg-86]MTB90585.1 hypothetical protein [Streptococcus sp. zg-36]MWV56077.1 hypothetical protein [Streptococcus sp. zg-70]QTH48294.1 hypothetical protein J5M87_02910 [Streptococcus sp. zg-86]